MSLDLLKTLPQYIIPKQGLTAFSGFIANIKNVSIKNYIIQRFIRKYKVNMSEALIEDPCAFACFNDFFIRHLKPECRPIAQEGIASPVDGIISEIGIIKTGQLLQAKGHNYTVQELLASKSEIADQFVHGQFATLYLAPKDYHRVHMPLDARLTSMVHIPGALFSVQPTTARVIPNLFSRNERLVVLFETSMGPMAIVLVGATIVGKIGTSWGGDLERSKSMQERVYDYIPFKKGDELGYFKLGSTVIVLFANGEKVQWNKSLAAGNRIHFGEHMGTILLQTEETC
ncbi:MAG: phosphatidylserine decarboxylase [Legionella sp.]|nr:phosphatidylserine decarboxylase [Legionella sp.]